MPQLSEPDQARRHRQSQRILLPDVPEVKDESEISRKERKRRKKIRIYSKPLWLPFPFNHPRTRYDFSG